MKTLVSTNVGNGYVKARSVEHSIVFPSVGAREQGAVKFDAALSGNGAHDLIIGFEDQNWAIGEAAYKFGRMQVQDMSRARVGQDDYLRLYVASLAATVGRSGPLAVVASLPLGFYNGDRDAARKALSGSFTVKYQGRTRQYFIDESDCHLIPEGFGALCAHVLTTTGKISSADLARSRIGIVDVGTRTTGFLRVDGLEIISAQSDMAERAGMSVVWTMLRETLSMEYGRELTDQDLDEITHSRMLRDSGQSIPVDQHVDTAIQALAEATRARVNSLWDNGRAVDHILITGGGGQFVYPYLTYPHVMVSESGYWDNAEGGFRFGLLRGLSNG